MPSRKGTGNTHDRKVREIAKELQNKKWNVRADISGFGSPKPIGKQGHTPDILATRGRKTKIIEVDTPDTVDVNQLTTFRRSASHSPDTDFEHVITTPKKNRD